MSNMVCIFLLIMCASIVGAGFAELYEIYKSQKKLDRERLVKILRS